MTGHRTIVALGWMLLVLCLACEDTDTPAEDAPGSSPLVEVSETALDFGSLEPGTTLTQQVVVVNVGEGPLYLYDLWLEGSASFDVGGGGLDEPIVQHGSVALQVTFAPTAFEEAEGVLRASTNDPELTVIEVQLTGIGEGPSLMLDPAVWDFGDLAVGCSAEQAISVMSVGTAPVSMQDVVFAPTSEELEFSYYFGPGTLLNPGEMETITIYYTPCDELPDTGYLNVYSNDPAQPDALATQTGTGHYAEQVCDEFVQTGEGLVDLLWVVDGSNTLLDLGTSLALNLSSVLDILEVVDLDWQMAIISTDDPVFHGSTPVITPSTPDPHAAISDALAALDDDAIDDAFDNVYAALTTPLADPGGPNEGFLRAGSHLHVVVVSDRDDASQYDVATHVGMLQGLLSTPDLLTISGYTGEAVGCSCAMGTADPAPRYAEAIITTGGLSESVCGFTTFNSLTSLMWSMGGWQDAFALSQDPVEETIEVSIDGVPLTMGWDYDHVLNAVVFQPDHVPDTGTAIEICYQRIGTCGD